MSVANGLEEYEITNKVLIIRMKYKVLHVLNSSAYSGAENVVITLIESYRDKVDALYMSCNGSIGEYLDERNIPYYPVDKITVANLKMVIKDFFPDIIHAHDFTTGIVSAATLTDIPIINHLHNNSPWIKKYNIRSIVYALSSFRYKKILTVSGSVMDEYVFGKQLKNKTVVVGNPVDISRIRNMAGSLDEKKYEIAFLGRITSPKNPFLFLDIISCIKKIIPDVKAVMIGNGELRNEVEKKIKEKGLNDTITLPGFVKNPYKVLIQSKVLCMPSAWEGFGLAAVEALALSLPVVCSKAGGLPQIIDDSCGALCNSTKEYVDAILKLLTDNAVYSEISFGAKVRSEKIGNVTNYSNKILALYDEVKKGEE